jgi:hypothetical protein
MDCKASPLQESSFFSASSGFAPAAGVTAKYSSPMISRLKTNLPAQNPEILILKLKTLKSFPITDKWSEASADYIFFFPEKFRTVTEIAKCVCSK